MSTASEVYPIDPQRDAQMEDLLSATFPHQFSADHSRVSVVVPLSAESLALLGQIGQRTPSHYQLDRAADVELRRQVVDHAVADALQAVDEPMGSVRTEALNTEMAARFAAEAVLGRLLGILAIPGLAYEAGSSSDDVLIIKAPHEFRIEGES